MPSTIEDLVARFSEQRESYVHSSYKEAQLRREFIDPMWKALGWDMDNEQGFAEQYKEVIHEDAIKLSSSVYSKAPDYCFRIGGVRKFFLEAKKPAVDIAGDPEPAFQLRSYAWSEKLPLSVLTDFEELSVYDTRVKPSAKDKASAARIISIRYTDYIEKWDEIAGIFSKDAVLKVPSTNTPRRRRRSVARRRWTRISSRRSRSGATSRRGTSRRETGTLARPS